MIPSFLNNITDEKGCLNGDALSRFGLEFMKAKLEILTDDLTSDKNLTRLVDIAMELHKNINLANDNKMWQEFCESEELITVDREKELEGFRNFLKALAPISSFVDGVIYGAYLAKKGEL